MKDAGRVSTDGLLTTTELAARPDFRLGLANVSPSTRTITGPGGGADVEPRVMQVLVVLADAAGQVVTRETLFQRCWGGVFVGDDSLNRAVAGVRKLATDIARGTFEIETIPRTGYRLMADATPAAAAAEDIPAVRSVSRRMLIGGSAAIAAIGLGSLWQVQRRKTDPRFDSLMDRATEALRLDSPESSKYLEQAVAIEPGEATAWGLLAYSLAGAVYSGQPLTGPTAQAAERAARRALAIDANQPDALLATTLVQSDTLNWLAREDRFRHILAIDPRNPRVLRVLGQLMHGVGRCTESLAIVERALAVEPLAPDHWVRKAMRLWVVGRLADADPVIDRAMQFWPSHRLVRLGRLMIYAYTGRTRAALTMVAEEERNPTFITADAIPVWRASLSALENPIAPAVSAARTANLDGAQGSPQIAAWGILTLSALGELDAAFEIANGFLLDRGSVIVRPRLDPRLPHVNNSGWRNTFGLFIPPTKAMRLDPRFTDLANGLDLTGYWKRRGIGPDTFLMQR